MVLTSFTTSPTFSTSSWSPVSLVPPGKGREDGLLGIVIAKLFLDHFTSSLAAFDMTWIRSQTIVETVPLGMMPASLYRIRKHSWLAELGTPTLPVDNFRQASKVLQRRHDDATSGRFH